MNLRDTDCPDFLTYLVLFLMLPLASGLQGQESNTNQQKSTEKVQESKSRDKSERDWSGVIGGGLRTAPIYEGSDTYAVLPLPYLQVTWKETVSFSPRGLTVDIYDGEEIRFAAGLTYDFGRDEDGDSLFGIQEDDRLEGMGDVDGAVGSRLLLSISREDWRLSGTATQYHGGDNDGFTLKMDIDKNVALSRRFRLSPFLGTTWVDENYMQTFFGVSFSQSQTSRFSEFDAESGWKDVHLGANSRFFLSRTTVIFSRLEFKHLHEDAAKSPISETDSSVTFFLGLGYRF